MVELWENLEASADDLHLMDWIKMDGERRLQCLRSDEHSRAMALEKKHPYILLKRKREAPCTTGYYCRVLCRQKAW
jgi:hypothetical protein